jgi:hypothetical protein
MSSSSSSSKAINVPLTVPSSAIRACVAIRRRAKWVRNSLALSSVIDASGVSWLSNAMCKFSGLEEGQAVAA